MGVMNPDSVIVFDVIDYTSRKSTIKLHANDNGGALTIPAAILRNATLRTSLALICGGTIVRQEWSPYITKSNAVAISNASVQRERQWKIQYTDNVTFAQYTLSIPCARVSDQTNQTIVDVQGFAIMTMPQWVAFKSAFEAVCRSRDKNNITMTGAYITGQNL